MCTFQVFNHHVRCHNHLFRDHSGANISQKNIAWHQQRLRTQLLYVDRTAPALRLCRCFYILYLRDHGSAILAIPGEASQR